VKGGARALLDDLAAAFNESGEGPVVISEGTAAYDAATKQIISETPQHECASCCFGYVLMGQKGSVVITHPKKVLPLASLTDFIDDWLKKHPESKIDYVHETTAIDRHCCPRHDTNIGFVLAPMNKSDLFKTVVLDGILPRKTFSMGQVKTRPKHLCAPKIKPQTSNLKPQTSNLKPHCAPLTKHKVCLSITNAKYPGPRQEILF
jgi:hypothetical protein